MSRQTKTTVNVSERNTKNEILEAYNALMQQVDEDTNSDDGVEQEEQLLVTAAKETVEKVTTELSQLRLSANQTINSLTEQLTAEAERFATLQKAVSIAQREFEETNQIKTRAGMLKRMIELHTQEEEKFQQELARKREAWMEEQKVYEDGLKKERIREEEEYGYQKSLRVKRDKDVFEDEKRTWERDLQVKKQIQIQLEADVVDLRKKVAQFSNEIDKAVKDAVDEAVAQERKEAQIRENFAKQEWDTKQQISTLKITSLEQTVKMQMTEIEELKRQLEKATQQVKDIAVAVIEGVKKDSDSSARTSTQALASNS